MRPYALFLAAGLFLSPTTPAALAQPQPKPQPKTESAMPRSSGAVRQETLDDFIAGFRGDSEAMDRALKDTDAILARDPNNAEALAWNASGKGAKGGELFGKGDIKGGMQLWKESSEGLNRAVELAPDSSTVRMVRGKSMLEASIYDPNPARSSEAAVTALGDLEKAMDLMGDEFTKSPQAYKQELYAWLFQAASKAGDVEKTEKYKKLAGDRAGGALDQLNQSAENTVRESARAALIILDSPLVQEIKADLLAGLRSPGKLDTVIALLDKKVEAKPDDAAAIAWRGFTRILRTSSIFSQGRVDEATKAWTKGLNEINAAASTDATTRDAVLLRALSNLELARHSTDADKRSEARQKATTDLARFQRMLTDASVTLSPQATAAFQLTTARLQLMNGDAAKARAAITAATAADPSPETAKRAKVYLNTAEMLEKKKS